MPNPGSGIGVWRALKFRSFQTPIVTDFSNSRAPAWTGPAQYTGVGPPCGKAGSLLRRAGLDPIDHSGQLLRGQLAGMSALGLDAHQPAGLGVPHHDPRAAVASRQGRIILRQRQATYRSDPVAGAAAVAKQPL